MSQRVSSTLAATLIVLMLAQCGAPPTEVANEISYIDPNPGTGTSAAVVVPSSPLALTTNFLPYDAAGRLVGREDADAQLAQVLENVRAALEAVGSDLDDIAKANLYVRSDSVADLVRDRFASTFSGEAKPAITFAVGRLRDPQADVAMDVTAVAPADMETLPHIKTDAVYGSPDRSHVSVLPPRGHVYVSGQVARGDDLIAAARETFEASLARLSYLGMPASSIEQVKVFLDDIESVDSVESALAGYFRDGPAPPIVSLEWVHEGFDIEIEMIASTPNPGPEDGPAITYATPPGLQAVPVYSRVATIHHGNIVYVSGLSGDASKTGEEQIREIYRKFEDILPRTGTDFDHLAKGQYYVVNWDVVRPLGTVRGEYYEPETPPTSSLIPVRGVGSPGAQISIDLIGVAPVEGD